jgi:hypothetical protein
VGFSPGREPIVPEAKEVRQMKVQTSVKAGGFPFTG